MTSKRGKASSDRQLSKLQRRILIWIHEKEVLALRTYTQGGGGTPHSLKKESEHMRLRINPSGIEPGGSPKYTKEVKQSGVPWSAKLFYDAAPTKSEVNTLSRALIALEKRNLIIRRDVTGGIQSKLPTKHVRLTSLGHEVACFLKINEGKSKRELIQQNAPAVRAARRYIHGLRGKLKKEKAYLEVLQHRGDVQKLWYEFLRTAADWRKDEVPEEIWTRIYVADLAEAERSIKKLEADIEALEEYSKNPTMVKALTNPKLFLPELPSYVHELLSQYEWEENHPPIERLLPLE